MVISEYYATELQTSIEETQPRWLKMYEFLHKQSLIQTFPNIEIALRIYLFLMVSYCSGERSFSKLKRIKNEFRNRIGQDRLNNASIMSTESDIIYIYHIYYIRYLEDLISQKLLMILVSKCKKRPF